ncbi:hypothetical protein IOD13_08700 [Brevibacterium casei]|nr:hypothetical protein [Brevibacterium casei]
MSRSGRTSSEPRTRRRRSTSAPQAGDPASSPRRACSSSSAEVEAPFSALCIGILVATLVAVLLLNIFISNTSYEIERLGAEKERLAEEKDRLVEDNSYRESPQNIAKAAEELGLVRDTSPEFLDAKTGKVIDAPPIDESGEKKPTVVPGPRADTGRTSDPIYDRMRSFPSSAEARARTSHPPHRSPRTDPRPLGAGSPAGPAPGDRDEPRGKDEAWPHERARRRHPTCAVGSPSSRSSP